MKNNLKLCFLALFVFLLLAAAGCASQSGEQPETPVDTVDTVPTDKPEASQGGAPVGGTASGAEQQSGVIAEPEAEPLPEPETPPAPASEPELQPQPESEPQPQSEPQPESQPADEVQREKNGFLVVIDPGHQTHGNSDQEPIGPGASETKNKVTGGTRGTTTGVYEYELNLADSLMLRDELESRGYTVLMTRTIHDVDMSNSERAAIANDAHADAFVRMHANGSDDPNVHGALTICQTRNNPYNSALYETNRRLSEAVLDALVAATGCKKERVWETDTMSGINWCSVPTTIVEVGYMTNPDEDKLLATDEYRRKIALGVANGLDDFFGLNR